MVFLARRNLTDFGLFPNFPEFRILQKLADFLKFLRSNFLERRKWE